MRDVNYGWALRYAHANGASFFFTFIYLHMGRGLYYGSYREPRTMAWNVGVIIFLLLIIIGFLGYRNTHSPSNQKVSFVKFFSNNTEPEDNEASKDSKINASYKTLRNALKGNGLVKIYMHN